MKRDGVAWYLRRSTVTPARHRPVKKKTYLRRGVSTPVKAVRIKRVATCNEREK